MARREGVNSRIVGFREKSNGNDVVGRFLLCCEESTFNALPQIVGKLLEIQSFFLRGQLIGSWTSNRRVVYLMQTLIITRRAAFKSQGLNPCLDHGISDMHPFPCTISPRRFSHSFVDFIFL